MPDVFVFILLAMLITGATTTLIVRWSLDYVMRKKGLTTGATESDVQEIRADIRAMRAELEKTQETLADMTFMLHDAAAPRLEKPDSEG